MRLHVHPDNPPRRKLEQAVAELKRGGIIVYPTDTVYAIGCAISERGAVERVCKLRGLDPRKANLSMVCRDLSQLSDYAAQLDNHVFRELKRLLPGPYTFILAGNKNVPKVFHNKKRTIGLRVPDNEVVRILIQLLGEPMLTASLKNEDDDSYPTDIEDIVERFDREVDVIIDSGAGGNMPSTVVDVTSGSFELVREGKGEWPV